MKVIPSLQDQMRLSLLDVAHVGMGIEKKERAATVTRIAALKNILQSHDEEGDDIMALNSIAQLYRTDTGF